jgi:hypothetical protein
MATTPVDLPVEMRRTRPPRQFQRRLSSEIWAQIITEYQAGASGHSLAKTYKVTDETIRRRLRNAGITPRTYAQPTFTGSNLDEALKLIDDGWNYAQIGRHFGVTRQAASWALKNKRDWAATA